MDLNPPSQSSRGVLAHFQLWFHSCPLFWNPSITFPNFVFMRLVTGNLCYLKTRTLKECIHIAQEAFILQIKGDEATELFFLICMSLSQSPAIIFCGLCFIYTRVLIMQNAYVYLVQIIINFKIGSNIAIKINVKLL